MFCPECNKDLSASTKITLPCECNHCAPCLTSWIIEKLGNRSKCISTYIVPCPNTYCLKRMKLSEIIPLLPEQYSSEISSSSRFRKEDIKIEEHSKVSSNLDSEANSGPKSSILQESLEFAKTQISDIMFAPCDICDRVTEKNMFCFNKICPKCEAKYCWVCKGSSNPYSYCVGHSCSKKKYVRFLTQLVFIVAFLWCSKTFGFAFESKMNLLHVIFAIFSLYILSKIVFVQLFFHKASQPERIYQGICLLVSSLILCTLPFNLLVEAVMIKIALNIMISWVFPPVVG